MTLDPNPNSHPNPNPNINPCLANPKAEQRQCGDLANELEIPNLSLDNALRNVHMAGWFDGLFGLMVKLIDAKMERMVSCCFRDEKGPGAKFGGLICMSDFKGKDLSFFLSKAAAPRKASGAG